MSGAAEIAAGLTTLAPDVPKNARERKAAMRVVNKVVRQIAMKHLGDDLLYHVYCAGLWHGSELAAQRILQETPDAR